jgi:hypothetical protein
MNEQRSNVIRFAAFGASGFGIGGLIYGLGFHVPNSGFALIFAATGFVVQAAPGGLALGWAMNATFSKTLYFSFLSVAGFAVGRYVLLLPFGLLFGERYSGDPPGSYLFGLLLGGISGVGLGLIIGLGSEFNQRLKVLVMAGGLGFGLGMMVTTPFYYGLSAQQWLGYMIGGIIGGGIFGPALGNSKIPGKTHGNAKGS